MSLAVAYNLRHILERKLSTSLTIFGIALVVLVAVATMMLSDGLNKTMAATGSMNNAIVIRNGAQNEIQSGVGRENANLILSEPEVARLADGNPAASTDVVVIISLLKRSDGLPSNVNLRGVSRGALSIRESVRVTSGRAPSFGTRELMIGRAINQKFAKTDLGDTIRIVGADWKVVGIFDAGNSGFSSEIWGDVEVLMPAFKRDLFSSVTFKLVDRNAFNSIKSRLENDRRLAIAIKREQDFYAEQSEALSMFIRIMGGFLSTIFALGAVIGAMITMYTAVATRTREVGILRALGFSKRAVFAAFMKECLLLALLGGVLGVILAAGLSFVSVTTTNFNTFSEIGFGFTLKFKSVAYGILFAVGMGILGGALPALRAARLSILDALRE